MPRQVCCSGCPFFEEHRRRDEVPYYDIPGWMGDRDTGETIETVTCICTLENSSTFRGTDCDVEAAKVTDKINRQTAKIKKLENEITGLEKQCAAATGQLKIAGNKVLKEKRAELAVMGSTLVHLITLLGKLD
jgi:hypothetical protein